MKWLSRLNKAGQHPAVSTLFFLIGCCEALILALVDNGEPASRGNLAVALMAVLGLIWTKE